MVWNTYFLPMRERNFNFRNPHIKIIASGQRELFGTTCLNEPEKIEAALVYFRSSVCLRKSLKIVTDLGIN